MSHQSIHFFEQLLLAWTTVFRINNDRVAILDLASYQGDAGDGVSNLVRLWLGLSIGRRLVVVADAYC